MCKSGGYWLFLEEEPESSSDEESDQSEARESGPLTTQEPDVSSSSNIEESNQKEDISLNQEGLCVCIVLL